MKRNYYIVFFVLVIFFVISFTTNLIGPLVPSFIKSFDLSLFLAGLMPLAFFIAYGVMSIPIIPLNCRILSIPITMLIH